MRDTLGFVIIVQNTIVIFLFHLMLSSLNVPLVDRDAK